MVLAQDATEDMTTSMEDVSSPPQITLDLLCKDVKSGIGTLKLAQNVPHSGISMLMEFVLKFQLFVPLTMPTEPVLDATVDTTLTTESVSSLLSNQSLMPDVTLGTTEFVKLALKTLSSTQMESAELSQINAELMISQTDGVLLVMPDMTSLMFSMPTTT